MGTVTSKPAEGMQVISKTLAEGLRAAGDEVVAVELRSLLRLIVRLWSFRPTRIIFTHGPGAGTVFASAVLRRITKAAIIWVATRPDIDSVPRRLTGRRTAHLVLSNRATSALQRVATDAHHEQAFLGIDPTRLGSSSGGNPWPDLQLSGRRVALHVGHLRRNRGLDLLIAARQAFPDRLEIIVHASPTFAPDQGLLDELRAAGVHVRQGFMPNIGDLYRAADLYLFPVTDVEGGAVELPLSVLEAVAAACPVLTTPYGAIEAALGESDGVTIISRANFVEKLGELLNMKDIARPNGLPRHLQAQNLTSLILKHGCHRCA